jgi:glutaredoxin-related protein
MAGMAVLKKGSAVCFRHRVMFDGKECPDCAAARDDLAKRAHKHAMKIYREMLPLLEKSQREKKLG